MTYVYVANYRTIGDMEAEQDDPSIRDMSLEHFAAPEVSNISLVLSVSWIDSMCKEIEKEVLVELENEPQNFEWNEVHDVPAEPRLENWVFTLTTDGQEVAKLVIQKCRVDE